MLWAWASGGCCQQYTVYCNVRLDNWALDDTSKPGDLLIAEWRLPGDIWHNTLLYFEPNQHCLQQCGAGGGFCCMLLLAYAPVIVATHLAWLLLCTHSMPHLSNSLLAYVALYSSSSEDSDSSSCCSLYVIGALGRCFGTRAAP